ncbi:MAG: hypothetical protein JWQ43_2238 [Glaciihabitans sp.]|nr:hypothetical protein [Glaciihabitans sp.]
MLGLKNSGMKVDHATGSVISASRAAWAGSAALLVFSGAATVTAASIRWEPCLRGLDLACGAAQDDSRQYFLASGPFEGIPGAVELAGLGSLFYGAFWLVWAFARRTHPATAVISFAVGTGYTFIATSQLLAGFTNGALGVIPPILTPLFQLVLMLPFVATWALRRRATPRARPIWVLMFFGLMIGHPLIEYAVLQPFSNAADTPTGTGWLQGAVAVLAGLAFFAAALVPAERHGRPFIPVSR